MAGEKIRARDPERLVNEMEYLKNTYSSDAFTFHDETFTFNPQRTMKICEKIKERKINVPWDCSTRVDCISKELLVKMSNAGCQLVSFGIESGSQKILNYMKKGTTVEQNEKAIKWAKEAGLLVSISVIIGYPGETEETLRETFNFIQKTEPDSVELSLATPYPGTELYDVVRSMGLKICDEWDRFDMQTRVFVNSSLELDLNVIRKKFYNNFYTSGYLIKHLLKRTFYGNLMARVAFNHILSRIKVKIFANKQLAHPKSHDLSV